LAANNRTLPLATLHLQIITLHLHLPLPTTLLVTLGLGSAGLLGYHSEVTGTVSLAKLDLNTSKLYSQADINDESDQYESSYSPHADVDK